LTSGSIKLESKVIAFAVAVATKAFAVSNTVQKEPFVVTCGRQRDP
jgi:hypothetical protein